MLSIKLAAGEYFSIGTLQMSLTGEWETYTWTCKEEIQS